MLQKIGFLPGFNKQITETTAEAQWVDGDNVRAYLNDDLGRGIPFAGISLI